MQTVGTVGRYVLYDEIAAGGMATVHLGRLRGAASFARTVAIKRLHPNYARDPEFVAMFLDEARLAARIRHPNVVSTVDVVSHEDELFLVMEYIAGEVLSRLIRPTRAAGVPVPPPIALAIMADVLHGLHDAHEARDEHGAPLNIVHRDISPHNVMVGRDGVTRVLDFGIAKAASRIATTRDGQLKGKISYMAPEQLTQRPVDRRTDVFAASIVLWEALTGERLFHDEDVGSMMARVLNAEIPRPSAKVRGISEALDAVVMRGLSRDAATRFPTAHAMATALEELGPARALQVGAWVESLAGAALSKRAERLAAIERDAVLPSDPPPLRATPSPNDVPTQILAEPSAPLVATIADPAEQQRASRRPHRWMFVALAVVLLAGGAFAMTRSFEPPTPTPVPEASSASPAPSPLPTPALTPASALTPAPAPTPSSPPAPPPAAAHPARPPAKKPAAAPPKTNCDPPYFIDGEGVKRFKPGCL